MRRGNLLGLPVSLAFFTFLSLFITAAAYVVLQDGRGEPLTNPADIVGQIGSAGCRCSSTPSGRCSRRCTGS